MHFSGCGTVRLTFFSSPQLRAAWLPLAALTGMLGGLLWPEAASFLHPFGLLFLQAIRMLVLPLVILSLLYGITHLPSGTALGRVGGRALFLFLVTTLIASLIGVGTALLLQPGAHATLPTSTASLPPLPTVLQNPTAQGFIQQLLPANPFQALAEGQLLPIIVLTILLGIAMRRTGGEARFWVDAIASLFAIFQQLIQMILWLAPLGVLALLWHMTAEQGLQTAQSLFYFMGCGLLACLLQVVFTYGGLLRFRAHLPLLPLLRKGQEAFWLAFSTSSSAATLPVTLKVAQEKLGISRQTSGVVLPLGMTLNMDGSALHLALAAGFVAQAAHITLHLQEWLLIIGCAMGISIGATGVPGVAGLGFILILSITRLPMEGMVLILAVERIMDMLRTTVNVMGDLTVSLLVDQAEGELNETQYRT